MYPKTWLYPFMLAAVAGKSDILAVLYSLCRNPELIGVKEEEDEMTLITNADSRISNRKRKRQCDFINSSY